MDFFENQERAQRNTGRLVVFFVLAVILIVAALNLIVAVIMVFQDPERAEMFFGGGRETWRALWDPELFTITTAFTLIIIVGGSLYKTAQLGRGGAALAFALGGIRVIPSSENPAHRRLLNVVEEMAIASGVPVPVAYILENEDAINAFAAGLTTDDAVVAVTRGAVERLSREELQAVVAHEFSHILNGDMRLNLRLIGIVHGIVLIGLIGYYILRVVGRGGSRVGGGRRKGGGAGFLVAVMAIAFGLMVVGFVGTFFGNLIKAAVSRQREFLADASAVQFTRNADALAGALKRIGGHVDGGVVRTRRAAEASHMFFSRALRTGLSSFFSTHPPLVERIRRIDPRWDGKLLATVGDGAPSQLTAPPELPVAAMAAADVPAVEQVGAPTPEHLGYAQALLARLPPAFIGAARQPEGARALTYALVISEDGPVRTLQTEHLRSQESSDVLRLTEELLAVRRTLPVEARLPLLELAIPSLRQLGATQYDGFRTRLGTLVRADGRVSLFEWVLERALTEHVGRSFAARAPRHPVNSLKDQATPLSVLLSTLARAGQSADRELAHAFEAGAVELGLPGVRLYDAKECNLARLDEALHALASVAPRLRKLVLRACAATIAFDKKVTVSEGELLRAIADTLGCPMPPLLPGQPMV